MKRLRFANRHHSVLVAGCAIVAAGAIFTAGCDRDDYNLGPASSERVAATSTAGQPHYYANGLGNPTQLNSQEFLAPADSGFEKSSRVDDPDALASQRDPLVQNVPAASAMSDREDQVAGNFKYYKEGYREPLLPAGAGAAPLQPVDQDPLGMASIKTGKSSDIESDIAGPVGLLGEVDRQHKWRAKYAKKHGKTLDPYGKIDYSNDKGDDDAEAEADQIIRSDAADTAPKPAGRN